MVAYASTLTALLSRFHWYTGGVEPLPNATDVRKGIDQRIRQLQRQAAPAEPTEASLRRQLRAQQPGRRQDTEQRGVAGLYRRLLDSDALARLVI